MQKRCWKLLALVFVSILVLSISLVSAFSFSDFLNGLLGKNKITGKVISSSDVISDLNPKSSPFTLSAWVNTTNATFIQSIYSRWYYENGDSSKPKGFEIVLNWPDSQTISIWDGVHNWQEVPSGIEAGKPYHLAITRSGTLLSVYVNGVKKGDLTITSNIPDVSSVTARVGRSHYDIGSDPGSTRPFKGTIKNSNGETGKVDLYNRALTSDEIKTIVVTGQTGTCTSFTYSSWGTCGSDGTQIRSVVSMSPAGCAGGNPVLSQSCTPSKTVDKDRCSELSEATKAKITEFRDYSKAYGRGFIDIEGSQAKKGDYVVIYSPNNVNKMSILRVDNLPGNSTTDSLVRFSDTVSGETFDFTTGTGQTASTMIDGYTYYLWANNNEKVADIDRQIILTWGDGSYSGSNGNERDMLNCVASTSVCTDSDGGLNYYVKGNIKGLAADGVISEDIDACRPNNFYGDGKDYVIEWFCDDQNRVNTNQVCENGCKDGACINPTQSTHSCANILVKSNVDGNGDAINLATSSQKLYENDPINKARSVLTKSELPNLLADGTIYDTYGVVYDYRQMITLGNSLITVGSSGESIDPIWMVQIGTWPQNPVYNYTLLLTKSLNISDSSVIGSDLQILGKRYVIGGGSSLEEVNLYESGVYYILSNVVGKDTTAFKFNGVSHKISLETVTSASSASIIVDGIRKMVTVGSEYRFAGDIIVYVKKVYPSQIAGESFSLELVFGGRPLRLINRDNVREGTEENSVENTRTYLASSGGKLTKIVVSQAAQESTGDYIPIGGVYKDSVFGTLDVEFEGLGCLPEYAQVCADLIESVKNPKPTDENDERRLNWNNSYYGENYVNGKVEKYNAYQAGYYWSPKENQEGQIRHYYVDYEIQVFDNKNVNLSEYSSWNKADPICKLTNYWVNGKENGYYICNWDILRNQQEVGNSQGSSRQIFWYNKNVVVRLNVYYGTELSDSEVAKLTAQRIGDLLNNIQNNRAKAVDWSNFNIEYPASNELYNTFHMCGSDIVYNWSNNPTSDWSCKIEPLICPEYGYQTKVCTRYNYEKRDEEVQENRLDCSPGICSGCYEPKWFGAKGDNKCIPYGFRFSHQTGEEFKLVERTTKDTISENVGENGEYSLIINSDSEAILTIMTDYKLQSMENFTLNPGKSVEVVQHSGSESRKIILDVLAIHPAVEDKKGYVEFSITYMDNERIATTFNAYCDVDGQIKEQRTKNYDGSWAKCQNNYECSSNICSDGECIELKAIASQANSFKTTLLKLMCKLSNLFSSGNYAKCLADYGI